MRTRSLSVLLVLSWLTAGCGSGERQASGPLELPQGAVCALDGMILADYPGPRAQIHYELGPPEFYCDTIEMFSIFLQPEQSRRVAALYVQDMAATDWDNPQGHWIDAQAAWYVQGSSRMGAMGPTFAAFLRKEDAEAFAARFGGEVLGFDQVTPDLVVLDGGALHDQTM